MKVIFEKLNIETTLEKLWNEGMVDQDKDYRKILNEIKFNEKWEFSDYWFDYFKAKDSDIIKASCHIAGTDSIGELQEVVNFLMEISGYDDLFIIRKDLYGDKHEEGYIAFESQDSCYPCPPSLKGGEYGKKSIMTDKEDKKFEKIIDNLWWDCSYTETYIERGMNYDPEKWAKLWIENKGR